MFRSTILYRLWDPLCFLFLTVPTNFTPVSEMPGLHPKPIGRKGAGNSAGLRPSNTSSRLRVGEARVSELPGEKVPSHHDHGRGRLGSGPRHGAGGSRKREHTLTHTCTRTHVLTPTHTPAADRRRVNSVHFDSPVRLPVQPQARSSRLRWGLGTFLLPAARITGRFRGLAPPGPLSFRRTRPREESVFLHGDGLLRRQPGSWSARGTGEPQGPVGSFGHVRWPERGGPPPNESSERG